MTIRNAIMNHINTHYSYGNFTAKLVAEGIGAEEDIVAKYLRHMCYSSGEIQHYLTGEDKEKYYRLVERESFSLEDVSDEELLDELKRRLLA